MAKFGKTRLKFAVSSDFWPIKKIVSRQNFIRIKSGDHLEATDTVRVKN